MEIAKKALQRKTGARGLRAILESILLDTMYDLPSYENITEVIINDEVVKGNAKPETVETPKTKKKKTASGA